jgi:aryl-alcohol dehydrogenase-like predicted oxidoreductase
MEQRRLGKQGLLVSSIGLGCMGMSASYGRGEESENIRVIHRAIDLGVNFFDTAEAYGPYENEVLLGKALRGRRDQVVIATKFGFKFSDGKITGTDGSAANVRRAVTESLKRLDTDCIDLLYQHRKDSNVPVEETVGAMADLVRVGKVRALGLSEVGPQTIRRAHAVHPICALQSEYSIWERGIEEQILPTLSGLEIGFVPFSPLGRGYLTGKINNLTELSETDYRQHDPRFVGENFQKNQRILDVVLEIAKEHGATRGQIAIAWVLSKGKDIVPIPGTKRLSYLEENIEASKIGLTTSQIERLNGLAQFTSGPRYNEVGMARVER